MMVHSLVLLGLLVLGSTNPVKREDAEHDDPDGFDLGNKVTEAPDDLKRGNAEHDYPDGFDLGYKLTEAPDKRNNADEVDQMLLLARRHHKEDCIKDEKGEDYRGKLSTTVGGYTCQKWTSQVPQRHDKTPHEYPQILGDNNYCRNPGSKKTIWCYTTDPDVRKDFCSLPICGPNDDHDDENDDNEDDNKDDHDPEDCIKDEKGEDYRGRLSTTVGGHRCQKWTLQSPQRHDKYPAKYPGKGLGDHNYCRNPNGKKALWCYTTDPDVRKEYCSLPICGNDDKKNAHNDVIDDNGCIKDKKGEDYRGRLSTTVGGYTCQKWTSQSPHHHGRTPDKYPNKGLGDHNYCRNPNGKKALWCYTTDKHHRKDYCSLPICGPNDDKNNDHDNKKDNCNKDDNKDDNVNMTEDCIKDKKGEDYRGKLSTTVGGHTCQKWTSQSPHHHGRTPDKYPNKGLGDHNYCRNPNGKKALWCYTTDKHHRKEYCSLPLCGNEDKDNEDKDNEEKDSDQNKNDAKDSEDTSDCTDEYGGSCSGVGQHMCKNGQWGDGTAVWKKCKKTCGCCSGKCDAEEKAKQEACGDKVAAPSKAFFNKDSLDKHNELRALHKDTPAMTWDTTLEGYAQSWSDHMAKSGKFAHSTSRGGGGENIYLTGMMGGVVCSRVGSQATQTWYDEIKDYIWETGKNKPGTVTGHFTQVVWKDSTKLGCGWATDATKKKTYVTCVYYGPGNYNGRYLQKVGALKSSRT